MRNQIINLRAFAQGDEKLLVKYLNNEEMTRFVSARIPQPYTFEAADWWITTGSKIGIVSAITHNDVLVGSISAVPGQFERQRSAEIGYWVAKPFWGQGVATDALLKFTDLVFSTTDLVRLYASVIEGNLASAKVLEKCGYKLEATLEKALYKHDQFFNELHYVNIHKNIF